jgi:non-homologous end joining protein Ku
MSITRTAPAPTRATTSVVLTVGVVPIPLSLFTAVESTAVIRHEFFNGDATVSVGRAPIRKDTGDLIHQSDVTRMAQADDGTWVLLDDDEVEASSGAPGGCEVVTFVPVKDVGQYLTDGLYQVRPKADKRGGAAATAAYATLLAGMTARKVVALVRVKLRGTPRYGLLTTTGDLLLIATADAVREALPLPDVKPAKADVAMMGQLIDAIGVSTPVVVDDWSPRIRGYVNDKAAANPAPATKAPANVVDITAVIAASIDAAKAAKSAAK